MQLGICRVTLENNNRCKICSFFAIPGNGQVLLVMPDIKLLNILTISCNKIGTAREGKDANCSRKRCLPMTWEVSSAVQTQGQKGAVKEYNSNAYYYKTQAKIQM